MALMINFSYLQIIFGFVLAFVLGAVSYYFRALTFSGAVGTIIIGTVVFGLGGWTISVPLLFFFISASILSKVKSTHKLYALQIVDKSGARDVYQVLANGGVAALALIGFAYSGESVWLAAYLAALCEACADTWATEIGTLKKVKTISVLDFKPVEPGRSGGISLAGTIASLGGSILTGLSFCIVAGQSDVLYIWLAASLAGFLGGLIDSVLGASVQARYFDDTNKRFCESKIQGAKLTGGAAWVTNDVVNFAGTLAAAIVGAVFFYFLQIN
jgi:uncharacterized protein (TIGR00297 family)